MPPNMLHCENWLHQKNGGSRYVQAWMGKDRKPKGLVVLIHGLGEHSGRYSPIAEHWVRAGYDVLASDHRGHGRTGGPLPAFRVLRDDIGCLLEAAIDTQHPLIEELETKVPLFLFGQSLGGALVLSLLVRNELERFASDHRQFFAIVSSPMLKTTYPPPKWKVLLGRMLGGVFPSFSLGNGIKRSQLTSDPNEIQRHQDDSLIHSRISAALGTTMLDEGLYLLSHAESLKGSNVPVLAMHGESDPIVSWRATAEFAHKASDAVTFKLFPGRLHELHFETEAEIAIETMLNWMNQRVEEPQAGRSR